MLNLTGLPNYHGKTNGQSKLKKIILLKAMNSMMLAKYQ